jgi:hypothetical protein
MVLSGNQARLEVRPSLSGVYGLEINVIAQTADGNTIDRAAFLTFEAEPAWIQTARNQVIVAAVGVSVLVLILMLARRRRTRTRMGSR